MNHHSQPREHSNSSVWYRQYSAVHSFILAHKSRMLYMDRTPLRQNSFVPDADWMGCGTLTPAVTIVLEPLVHAQGRAVHHWRALAKCSCTSRSVDAHRSIRTLPCDGYLLHACVIKDVQNGMTLSCCCYCVHVMTILTDPTEPPCERSRYSPTGNGARRQHANPQAVLSAVCGSVAAFGAEMP